MRMRIIIAVVALAALAAGCSDDDGDTSTTLAGGTVTALPGAATGGSTTVAPGAVTTTIVLAEPVIPTWTIASTEEGDDGSTIVVVLDPESYDSLTDIDLQNVIAEVVDSEGAVLVAHVVDDPAVADMVLLDDTTPAQNRQLDQHYLARLEDGFRIVFLGPFADTAAVVLGS
ncbi:MAG: hypothetical protein M3349_02425 [Actinomycetota bacterium]|nr:hypothetical protein [Actinomycetota bacterium]